MTIEAALKEIAVVGAGVMGCDVALDLASHGYQVILKDVSGGALEAARARIAKSYRLFKMIKKEFADLSLEDIVARIQFVDEYRDFEKVDLVIENITESYDAKAGLFQELRSVCRSETIFGLNTSCISITKIASLLPRPENVIGMHFLNPVPLKKLVEVVRGFHTSAQTLEKTKEFLKSLDKSCVVVNDYPGFVTNRVLMLMINECVWLVQDQVAEPRDIDKIFSHGFGHKMGPLATADLIGLDTILNSLLVLYESYHDPKFRPAPLLQKMVDAGRWGRKTGRGFFDYRTPDRTS